MAIVPKHCIIYTDLCTLFQFDDRINWGAPEEERNAAANVLIVAHVNEDLTEDFLTIDSIPYLTKTNYDVNNTVDGHYLFELLRFFLYNAGTAYLAEVLDVNDVISTYASLQYYGPTNKFYKCIANVTGIAPDAPTGSTYWLEITDFTVDSIRENSTITVYAYDDIAICRSKKCVKNELISLGCGCEDMKKMLSYFKKKVILDGAQALADDLDYNKAETNIRLLENMCPKC